MGIKVKISSMKSKDVPLVYKLGVGTRELQIDPKKPTYYPKTDLNRLIKSEDGVCLIATVDGKFAGFSVAIYHSWCHEGYLSDLVVKSEFRNLGVGRMLFDEQIKRLKAKGARWTWGLTQDTNKFMQKFLKKRGFKRGTKFYFYYKKD